MTEDDDFQFFDRVIKLKNEEVKSFFSDPEGYLRRHGALDGLPEFNGVMVAGNKTLESLAAAGPIEIDIVHHPAPWRDRCSWWIQP
ncbi:hypothetical protein [Mesorhizobium sp. CA4]|uniref:hypothetical protein n=1 Tax=Mesorhizobium sp. CA4 TaxID=588499 RepID=UPI001CD15F68|nr:hypothetical protein [Mesorhizobium sp. CA4]MBZ9821939.1 hypothetical protein [Mesorhizobium sp. CA4]